MQAVMKDNSLTLEMRQAKVSAMQTVSAIFQRQVSGSRAA